MGKPIRLLLTCEHGGNRVPRRYSRLFRGHERLRANHRGYDLGALDLARRLSKALRCRLIASTTTRLLVDLNRSVGSPNLFSVATRNLDLKEKKQLLATCYHPYRSAVEASVSAIVAEGDRVLHIGVHTFTPRLRGVKRRAGVGLLYDPSRPGEQEFCKSWQALLADEARGVAVRRNYPYRGTADGLPRWLRRTYPDSEYLGIELEVNQRLIAADAGVMRIAKHLISSLQRAVAGFSPEYDSRLRKPRGSESGP
ncbi:MAG: N-formylglutamate amidohydrolase [Phycisphaerales bacterium]|nr:MAG: N-formylglutamate amidohydrolase [Phycisphaerales bacterium]